MNKRKILAVIFATLLCVATLATPAFAVRLAGYDNVFTYNAFMEVFPYNENYDPHVDVFLSMEQTAEGYSYSTAGRTMFDAIKAFAILKTVSQSYEVEFTSMHRWEGDPSIGYEWIDYSDQRYYLDPYSNGYHNLNSILMELWRPKGDGSEGLEIPETLGDTMLEVLTFCANDTALDRYWIVMDTRPLAFQFTITTETAHYPCLYIMCPIDIEANYPITPFALHLGRTHYEAGVDFGFGNGYTTGYDEGYIEGEMNGGGGDCADHYAEIDRLIGVIEQQRDEHYAEIEALNEEHAEARQEAYEVGYLSGQGDAKLGLDTSSPSKTFLSTLAVMFKGVRDLISPFLYVEFFNISVYETIAFVCFITVIVAGVVILVKLKG